MSDGREVAKNVAKESDFSLLPDFPLTTVDQLQACNVKLEDKDIRQLFVSILLKNKLLIYMAVHYVCNITPKVS